MIARLIAIRKSAGIHCRSPVRGRAGRLLPAVPLLLFCGRGRPCRLARPPPSHPAALPPYTSPPMQVKIVAAERDVYAAEIEGARGKLLMKIGPGDFVPTEGKTVWAIADCGHNWGVWEAKL